MSVIVAPSVLAADFAHLGREINMINESKADWIHVDIMDGVFVPNLSMGLPVVEAINRYAKKMLDVHLMVVNPDPYLEPFRKAGAGLISVHAETCQHLHRTLWQIRALGCKAGVALNPHTPVSVLENVLADIDLVCVMSVNPGFGGQKFIENTYEKIRQLKQMMGEHNPHIHIEIDGGVNLENAPKLIQAGANVLVAGNFVFTAQDPQSMIGKLKDIA